MSALGSLSDAVLVPTPHAQRTGRAHGEASADSSFLATLRQLEGAWGPTFEAARLRVSSPALPAESCAANFVRRSVVQLEGDRSPAGRIQPEQRPNSDSIAPRLSQPRDDATRQAKAQGTDTTAQRDSAWQQSPADRAPPAADDSENSPAAHGRHPGAVAPLATLLAGNQPLVGDAVRVPGASSMGLTGAGAQTGKARTDLARSGQLVSALNSTPGQTVGSNATSAAPLPPPALFIHAPVLPQAAGQSVTSGADDLDQVERQASVWKLASTTPPPTAAGPLVAVTGAPGGLAISVWSALRGHELTPGLRKAIDDEVARHGCRLARLHLNGNPFSNPPLTGLIQE